MCLLCLLPEELEISYYLHVHWRCRLTGLLEGPVVQDLLGGRHVGTRGVEHRSKTRSFSIFLDSCEVLSVVLRILTCHSVNPLDVGKWGDEVT